MRDWSNTKLRYTLIAPAGIRHEAMGMLDGHEKRSSDAPLGWRKEKIPVSVQLDAAMRHINAFLNGEDTAADSGVHHLGHARCRLGMALQILEDHPDMDDRVVGFKKEN